MNDDFDPPDMKSALAQIADYARRHKLTPAAVSDMFSAGLCAARILAPDLTANEIVTHNPNVELTGGALAPSSDRRERG